jgi:hypothetical protein
MSPAIDAVNAMLEDFAVLIPSNMIVILLKSLMMCTQTSRK